MRSWRFYGLLTLLILAVIGVFFFWLMSSGEPPRDHILLTEADKLYNQGDYNSALPIYEHLLQKSSEGHIVDISQKRMKSIEKALLAKEKIDHIKRNNIQELVNKALAAYRKENYLMPAHDNAISHIGEIFKLDPENSVAHQIQQLIIEDYTRKADVAVKDKQYHYAINYYSNILDIVPHDTITQKRLSQIVFLRRDKPLRARRANHSVDRSVSSSVAQQEEIGSSESAELKRLLRQIKDDSLKSISVKSTPEMKPSKLEKPSTAVNNSNLVADASKESISSLPESSAGKKNISSLPQATTPFSPKMQPIIVPTPEKKKKLSENSLPVPKKRKIPPAKRPIAIVNEALIDQGKRKYLVKKEPRVPSSWDYGGFSVVQAECIVGITGKVETVKIVTPSLDSRLNKLSLETLKKYRYKPATHQNKPTRFRVIESIHYTRFR